MLGKLKNKLNATRFEFSFVVHMLQPWPAGNKAIAIGWQRGKKRRGATKSVYPSAAPGRLGNVVRFNERFDIPSTLYKANSGPQSSTNFGPFKKKCLILAVLETDGRTQATAALGRVVIDLSEYAAIDNQEMRTFHVACNKSIHAAVGDPQLTVTIRCRLKKASIPGANGDMTFDETASMSTDTTGSRLTANLNSMLRFQYSGRQFNEEQDLRGFESARVSQNQDKQGFMEAIQEGQDEPHEVGKVPPPQSAKNSGPFASQSFNNEATVALVAPSPESASKSKEAMFVSPGALAMAASLAKGSGPGRAPLTPRSESGSSIGQSTPPRLADMASEPIAASTTYSSLSIPASPSNSSLAQGPNDAAGEDGSKSRWRNEMARVLDGSLLPTGNSLSGTGRESSVPSEAPMDSVLVRSLQAELLSVAAMETAFHFAQIRSNRTPAAAHHAPARRLARTLAALEPSEGTGLGRAAVRILEGHSKATKTELGPLAFWWSNTVHLRALLHTSSTEASTSSLTPSTSDMGPKLLRIERALFDEVLARMWAGMLSMLASSKGAKKVTQESAIKRWLDSCTAVWSNLTALGQHGHVSLLQRMVMRAVLRRLDVTLLANLLGSTAAAQQILLDYDPEGSVWGGQAPQAPPKLDDASLPFTPGALTFGTGMTLKMAATRLVQWASGVGSASGAVDKELAKGVLASGSEADQLFPLLRAAADLLMMPKDLLGDRAIRTDITANLTPRTVIYVAQQFSADEYAPEAVPPPVLDTLRQDLAGSGESECSPLPLYTPLDPSTLISRAEKRGEPGIEYGADSEDELEYISNLSATSMDQPSSRFRMLHELWSRTSLQKLRSSQRT